MKEGVLVALLATAACGRFGFDEGLHAGDVGIDGLTVALLDITPRWLPPTGGEIVILIDGDATGATATIDGAPCTSAITDNDKLTCTAPPRSPGVVELVVTTRDGVGTFSHFTYLTPGAYQLGTAGSDRTSGVAIDRDGNVYLSGATDAALDGPAAGDFDSVLVKYDASGSLQWVRQLGTPTFDYARDVAIDPVTQSPTIVGYTDGALGGRTNAGGNDVFVARYTPDGDLVWLTLAGTAGDDQAWDLAVDASGATVVAVRTTGDLDGPALGLFDYGVIRLAANGDVAWARRGGTALDDIGHSITVAPDGTAYLVGYTQGSIDGTNAGMLDMFVARFDADGTPRWIRQRGTATDDEAHDVTVDDAGDIWISGITGGALDGQTSGGGTDVFVMRYSPAGTWIHTRQYGGAAGENTFGIAVSPQGTVVLSCTTSSPFNGATPLGAGDICAVAADRDGNHKWTRIVGTTTGNDQASSCAVDRLHSGLFYISAQSNAALGPMAYGTEDIAVVKLDESGTSR